MKDEYPDVKQDLYGAFVVRGIELAGDSGLLAIVVGDAWMSLKSFEALRLHLQDGHSFNSLLHLRDVAYHAESFGANAAFVLSINGDPFRPGPFVRLTSLGSDRKARDLRHALAERTEQSGFHLAASADFSAIPGSPIVYWLSEKMRSTLAGVRTLGTLSPPRQGLSTGDNNAFMRLWWEPSARKVLLDASTPSEVRRSAAKWVPYNKGGEFRKWYGNQEYLVDWADDGEAIGNLGRGAVRNANTYFRPSVSWTNVSSGDPAFRCYPEGFIASASTGDGVFPATPGDESFLAAILNSSVSLTLLAAVSPGLTFNVGSISGLPLPESRSADLLVERVEHLVVASKDDWNSAETSWGFDRNALVASAG